MGDKKYLRKLDIFLLILFPIMSVILSLLLKASFLASILLFFGLPAVWLSYRTRHMIKKTLIFSLIFSIPLSLMIDYVAVLDKSWFVPSSVFSFRIFNVVAIEGFVFGFLLVYAVLIFYEHFLDKSKYEIVDKKMKYLILPLIILSIVFFALLLLKPGLLRIKYAYLCLGIIFMLLPAITFLSFFPRLVSKYVKTASYFFMLLLIFEITGLQLNQWTFPGENFIGWIQIFNYKFPLEEFFFWIILSSTGILSYYEFFDDDRR